jgi:hypothetical protein
MGSQQGIDREDGACSSLVVCGTYDGLDRQDRCGVQDVQGQMGGGGLVEKN